VAVVKVFNSPSANVSFAQLSSCCALNPGDFSQQPFLSENLTV
jgi:hypothetical protein